MISFRTGASRSASVPGSRLASPAGWNGRPTVRPEPAASPDDAAIRREFETLAERIRTLQLRAAREAASLRAAR